LLHPKNLAYLKVQIKMTQIIRILASVALLSFPVGLLGVVPCFAMNHLAELPEICADLIQAVEARELCTIEVNIPDVPSSNSASKHLMVSESELRNSEIFSACGNLNEISGKLYTHNWDIRFINNSEDSQAGALILFLSNPDTRRPIEQLKSIYKKMVALFGKSWRYERLGPPYRGEFGKALIKLGKSADTSLILLHTNEWVKSAEVFLLVDIFKYLEIMIIRATNSGL
jgi:hypothetical protein